MLIVVCFDVFDDRRRRRVADALENHGQRVQYSVFECHLDESQLRRLEQEISALIDEREDHVRYYRLCPKDLARVMIDGTGEISSDADFHLI